MLLRKTISAQYILYAWILCKCLEKFLVKKQREREWRKHKLNSVQCTRRCKQCCICILESCTWITQEMLNKYPTFHGVIQKVQLLSSCSVVHVFNFYFMYPIYFKCITSFPDFSLILLIYSCNCLSFFFTLFWKKKILIEMLAPNIK